MLPKNLPKDFMISDTDGCLYDTSKAGWSGNPPIRTNYRWSHREIKTVADLKATLRAGAWAWPGGYPMYFITSDGGALSFETVRKEFRRIAESVRDQAKDGWTVVACDINYENKELYDDHTNKRIESAYE